MNLPRVAIIGGGFGGLLTAYLLQKRLGEAVAITLYEASNRLGGKIVSGSFPGGATYEAGAAELYDYSQLGPDPLRELVAELGLKTSPIEGSQVVMNGRILQEGGDQPATFGPETGLALADFRRRARAAISPAEYYSSDWQSDNADPLSRQTFADLLAMVPDAAARHYIQTVSHSDLACEPAETSAMYGLQNYLMDEPDYMQLYTVDGGIEVLPKALASRVTAEIRLGHRVSRVAKRGGKYIVSTGHNGSTETGSFDFVVAALPNNWLPRIQWDGELLSAAVARHQQFYNHPAHYLRVTLLYPRAFWREKIKRNYFMLDAFGGCCVYDEGWHRPPSRPPVLGLLLAGKPAEEMALLSDEEIVRQVVAALPSALGDARGGPSDARVHRWIDSVNAWPAGYPAREPDSRHQPEPNDHPELFFVGDYLFDSTLNGVADSADVVSEWIAEELATEPVK